MQQTLRYHNKPEYLNYLFDSEFQRVVSALANVAGDNAVVDVFPDAVLKANRIPTGVAVTASKEEALLFPQLLRDPGCGFLSFNVHWKETPGANWQHQAGQLLNEKLVVNTHRSELKAYQLLNTGLNNILSKGLLSLELSAADLHKFERKSFPVLAEQINLSHEECEILYDDFLTLTNTIEIRKMFSLNLKQEFADSVGSADDFFGFVHCGSLKFPGILAKRFIEPIYEYALADQQFSNEAIDSGLYAVPYYTELGQNYVDWINAAMNYALVNRYGIFTEIKYLLETHFPCEVEMLNDILHAGLFVNKDQIIQTRGTQNLQKNTQGLIAGQRESVAAIVEAKQACLLPHGTGDQNKSFIHYRDHFSDQENDFYLAAANNAFYNTKPDFNTCIPHAFNLKQSLNWLMDNEVIVLSHWLSPLINIQSRWLQSDDQYSGRK